VSIKVPARTRVVLLDIEGTTTPISFVHDTLFAYARTHLDGFLAAHSNEADVRQAVSRLSVERLREDGPAPTSPAAYARWLMDRDRKSPGLKQLQGLIWEEGYKAGELRGTVWDDVPPAIERWRASGLKVAIYSSGSELAQRRLFETVASGDLTSSIDAFFDTAVGSKQQSESYRCIAEEMKVAPDEILFVSDVTGELGAAKAAGCQVVLALRPGNPTQPDAREYSSISTFDDLVTR